MQAACRRESLSASPLCTRHGASPPARACGRLRWPPPRAMAVRHAVACPFSGRCGADERSLYDSPPLYAAPWALERSRPSHDERNRARHSYSTLISHEGGRRACARSAGLSRMVTPDDRPGTTPESKTVYDSRGQHFYPQAGAARSEASDASSVRVQLSRNQLHLAVPVRTHREELVDLIRVLLPSQAGSAAANHALALIDRPPSVS
jgi:hypothetical protein